MFQRNDCSTPYGHLTLQRTDSRDIEDAVNPSGVCGLAHGISRLGVPLGGDADFPLRRDASAPCPEIDRQRQPHQGYGDRRQQEPFRP